MTTLTAQEILNQANAELGLPSAIFNGPPGDQTGRQASALMQAVGDNLLRVHDWQFLEGIDEYTGDGSTDFFNLPPDFGRIVNQTFWATSENRMVRGPVSPQTWGWLKYGLVSSDGTPYRFRIYNNLIRIHPAPADGLELKFYYIKKNWVLTAVTDVPKSTVTLPADVPLFDARLMISGLKVLLWGQKGFDTTQVQAEFNYILASEKSISQGAAVLSIVGGDSPYLLSTDNLPEGSWNI